MTVHQLTPAVGALIVLAGVVHAAWNAIASRINDRLLAFGLIGVSQTVVAAVALALVGPPRGAAVPFAIASMVVHVAYTYALLHSFRLGGFGRAYPLARGTSPLLVAVGGWFLASEQLDWRQIAGTCMIAAGLLAIALASGRPRASDRAALAMAVLTGVTIAAYTVIDGLGVRRAADPTGYVALLFVGEGPPAAAIAAWSLRRTPRVVRGGDVRRGLTAGVLSMLAYGIVVWAQTRAPLALVSALRETSVISAALISALLLREPLASRRIAPAVAVAVGVILVAA